MRQIDHRLSIRNAPVNAPGHILDGAPEQPGQKRKIGESVPEPNAEDGIHVERHRDGSVRARGPMAGGEPDGYWEWFRLDGTRMRSGHFDRGRVTGEWTTYDRAGVVYKVTRKP